MILKADFCCNAKKEKMLCVSLDKIVVGVYNFHKAFFDIARDRNFRNPKYKIFLDNRLVSFTDVVNFVYPERNTECTPEKDGLTGLELEYTCWINERCIS